MNAPRRIVLLGATGSIGQSTQAVVRQHREKLQLVGLAAGQNREGLAAVAQEFDVRETRLFADDGLDGLIELATLPEADIVLIAATGTIGLQPALAALAAGKDIALASKEILVAAGQFVMETARQHGRRILPIDSEHNALFQCLEGSRGPAEVKRLILTASGGAFRDWTPAQMATITPAQALQHPTWDMGPKVTIDCATLANKGLEMIEARWLFDIPPARIEAVIHRQSIVHSMVEYVDGSILAQLSPPSMTFPIQHALLYPERLPGAVQSLDFREAMTLEFAPPDEACFPCLRLAREAMQAGGTATAAFHVANEGAVNAFVAKRLPFLAIPAVIEDVLTTLPTQTPTQVADILTFMEEAAAVTQQALARATD